MARVHRPRRTAGPRLVRAFLLAALAVLWWGALRPTGMGGPLGLVWVSGTSMEPTMHTGDLVVTHRADDYEVGDVVAFEIPEGGTVIHRVVERTSDGYRFRGDNRDFRDPWTLPGDAVVGREVVRLPHAGTVAAFLGRPAVMAAMAALLVVIGTRERHRPGQTRAGTGIRSRSLASTTSSNSRRASSANASTSP